MTGILSITISIIGAFMILGAILVILNDNQDSGRKIAWILIIGILPVIGLLLYIVFGMNFRKPGFFQYRNRQFLDIFEEKASQETKNLLFDTIEEDRIRPEYRSPSRLLKKDSGLTVTDNNEVEIITSGGIVRASGHWFAGSRSWPEKKPLWRWNTPPMTGPSGMR